MDDGSIQHSHLNPSQQLHLLTSCQYADKLLGEIEGVLTAAESRSPFPRFQPDISPTQAKVVRDYIERIRSQILRILESQGVPVPAPRIGSIHSIAVTLGFIDIAFEECRPKRMVGYGEVSETDRIQLNGLVDELQGIASKLTTFLTEGQPADLSKRLERLEHAGADIGSVQALERVIDRYGLVEFRPALAMVIERMESTSFEIAMFGRVSSGKSSLLNHIAGQNVLPVGVNPITAVPTRLVYGSEPRATVSFADRKPERIDLAQLAEFASEQQNPSNRLHVTRIVVEVPSEHLREGVVYVDTPGLGSLATSGAAETKAYLPRCDLGVVLIDAGATLTQEDLATIRALYDAGIPASVVLSKADLLAPADRERVREYIAGHIHSDLGLDLSVHAVSIEPACSELLESWLNSEIVPLYARQRELARQSLSRKIGGLRMSVEAALRARSSHHGPTVEADSGRLRAAETGLREAAGKIAEARTQCMDQSDLLREAGVEVVKAAAIAVVGEWESGGAQAANPGLVRTKIEQAVAGDANRIAALIRDAAEHAGRALVRTARVLGSETAGSEPDELTRIVTEMPRFELGVIEIDGRRGRMAFTFGRKWTVGRLESRICARAGHEIDEAMRMYGRVMLAWVRKAFADLQAGFDSQADAYRAQLGRLVAGDRGTPEEETLQEDLAAIALPAGAQAPGAAA
jgi:GTP-binding protein EngB required for normal cell division